MTGTEHQCWCPKGYREGIAGQRIAICGFSHYSDEGDDPELTNIVVSDVIAGANYRFFSAIARSFLFDDVGDFLNRVMFFNFIPTSVGTSDDRYAPGTDQQIEHGRLRVIRLLQEHKPHKLFVFSRKAWNNYPPTIEEAAERPLNQPLGWGTYVTANGHRTIAVGIRHPQFASAATLRGAVVSGMAL